jgi:hypothetical protein
MSDTNFQSLDTVESQKDESSTKLRKTIGTILYNALSGSNWIFGAILCLYVGYSDTQHLCSNTVLFQNKLILDPDSLLGPSGHIITWFRISGITRAVFVGLQPIILYHKKFISALLSLYLLFAFGMSIYGLVLIFGEKMPQQCVDYQMGNNFAYIVLYFICIWDLIIYTLLGMSGVGLCISVGTTHLLGKNVNKFVKFLSRSSI